MRLAGDVSEKALILLLFSATRQANRSSVLYNTKTCVYVKGLTDVRQTVDDHHTPRDESRTQMITRNEQTFITDSAFIDLHFQRST